MGLFDRLILAIYSFFFALLSIIVILATFDIITLDKYLSTLEGRWEIALAAAVFLIVSLRFLLSGIYQRRETNILVKNSNLGEIKITAKAVENLVQKTAREMPGIRDVKAKIFVEKDIVDIKLYISVMPDIAVPPLSEDLQVVVKEKIQELTGVAVSTVKINVDNLTNESKHKTVIN